MATVTRSTNCANYTDTVSLVVGGTASVPGMEATCTAALPTTFSCQTSAYEAPDAATAEMLAAHGRRSLEARGCPTTSVQFQYHTNLVGAQSVEYSAEKLNRLGMASNCFREGNDPNHATHRGEARCAPMYDMTDAQGNRVRNTNMSFLSNLAVCDLSDEAMPQVQEDLRKVAAHNAGENGYKIDRPEDLACSFSVLPVV